MFGKDTKHENYIDGKWRSADAYINNYSPSNAQDHLGSFAVASEQDVEDALVAARAALQSWSGTGLEQRQQILMQIGNELIERSQEIGKVLSREEGKTLAEGAGEVYRAGQFFQYYAAQTLRIMGDLAESVRPNIDVEVRREPVGVVAVITPWNFPMAVAAWKVAPALAYGNSVVLKPSEVTPACAVILAEIISRTELPAGAFNLVMGEGATVGQQIASSPMVNAVTFTGSVPVGRAVASNALSHMAKIQLEMGSKNALLVSDDADLDVAVSSALNGAFFGCGQKCTASSRLVVDSKVHDAFVERLKTAMADLNVGDPLDPNSQIGAMASQAQFDKVMSYIDMAKSNGAELAQGGNAIDCASGGLYIEPTLFTNTSNDMQINRDEVFGPVACVIKVDNYEQGLAVVNDTEFGLTAGIVTQSLSRANHFKKNAQAGCVMVNLPTAGTDYHVPFGGQKASSYGTREQGQYAEEFYTNVKTSYVFAG